MPIILCVNPVATLSNSISSKQIGLSCVLVKDIASLLEQSTLSEKVLRL
jgi:hypothetical protein